MSKLIPNPTVQALAGSIYRETSRYGFETVDVIRLVNQLLDLCKEENGAALTAGQDVGKHQSTENFSASSLPLKGERVRIRPFDESQDLPLLERWLPDKYGRYFVLSCATAQTITVEALISSAENHLAMITTLDDAPIGAMAYLDHNKSQKRAELRKLIGEPDARGIGLAEEATRLWLTYGIEGLGLEKIYVSTLQTHISNIKLNENIGFSVEGLLRDEVLIDGERHDVLRMGLSVDGRLNPVAD